MNFAWRRAGVAVLCLAQSCSGCPLIGTELAWMSFGWHRVGVDVLCLAQSWRGCPLVGTELEWISFAWHRAGVDVSCLAQSYGGCSWSGCALVVAELVWMFFATTSSLDHNWTEPNVHPGSFACLSQRRMDISIHFLLQPPDCRTQLPSEVSSAGNLES